MQRFYYATSWKAGNGQRSLPAVLLAAAFALIVSLAGCGSASGGSPGSHGAGSAGGASGSAAQAATNPDLDPGSSLGGVRAPDFSLVNQFGQHMSLSDFRGKVVIVAFTDSQCTTVCPLTSESMLAAKQLLGAAGSQVQLLGVDANPQANRVSNVLAYSRAHGMVNQWDFLTGSDQQLSTVWKAYHIYVQIQKGQIDHTPAVYVIGPTGLEEKVYMTTMAYASIPQAAQVLATEAASLLPGHPRLASTRSLAYISGLTPAKRVSLATLPSGQVTLGPGRAHLVMFFATWLTQTSDLTTRLRGLKQYVSAAARSGLPGLVAVDEEAAESSPAAVRTYLATVGKLAFPVALDPTGRLADGYGVQDQPWFTLTSASGKIIWKHDGWLPASQLVAAVRAAVR